jgi:lipopolysaccharide transport system ATP-binding protein
MKPIIEAQNLSKRYFIGAREESSPSTLREAIMANVRSPQNLLRRGERDFFWALDDVSFEVMPGEVLGIVGHNGSGKSTLLKILSRITRPTKGHGRLNGRIASLLEIGSGFHPDLTGRHNVFLNGAILGMKRREILERFDEIVAFAEVEKFIDTPVKRYSSGMYMRLAFAVAAHLEAEIVLVDEVLAVGDASFQRKCIDKMRSLSRSGQTILMVSHNAETIRFLCGRALLLENGQMIACGDASEVVGLYQERSRTAPDETTARFPLQSATHGLTLNFVRTSVEHETRDGKLHAHLHLEFEAEAEYSQTEIGVGVRIHAQHTGNAVTHLVPEVTGLYLRDLKGAQTFRLECRNIEQYLAAGEYSISLGFHLPQAYDALRADYVASFEVPVFNPYPTGRCLLVREHGVVPLPLRRVE